MYILIRLAILVIAFIFLSSCLNKSKKQPKQQQIELEEITSRMQENDGFQDIFLKIVQETKTDSTHIYIAKGLYKKKTVGLQFEVLSHSQPGIVNGQISGAGMASNGVRLKSTGIESDNFINALEELYKLPITKGFSTKVISASSFCLSEQSVNLDQLGYYKLKLFFETDSLYSELYCNINTEKKEIELHEKDEDYREPLIQTLTN